MRQKKKIIKNLISEVNKTLVWYKKGGWIDTRRTPNLDEKVNLVENLEEFIEARFNRESWNVPELNKACDLLDGRLFTCVLDEADEVKKRFKTATLSLIKEEDIIDPTPELLKSIREAREFLGGSKIIFNSVKVKVKFEIKD